MIGYTNMVARCWLLKAISKIECTSLQRSLPAGQAGNDQSNPVFSIQNPDCFSAWWRIAMTLTFLRWLFAIRTRWSIALSVFILFLVIPGCKPKEDVQLRQIKDVIVDATSEPLLKANAILYNPNNIRMMVKKIDMEVFVDGKKAAVIDQQMKLKVPAQAEFTVPLEVKLNMKEIGLLDAVFAVIGGKKFQIHYKGTIRLQYKGVPFSVPVNHKEEIRIRL
ncbi:MAG: LEA type 2 family protein [Cyclobacteriaceae bacterium]|nr:LEA type 2 family protein [Cyclobacteriaceae bacterium]